MDKLLLEYPWLPKVVSQSKEHGLDWLMMACIALELSAGDPRCRTLDGEFLYSEIHSMNPLYAMYWYTIGEGDDEISVPTIKVIDQATRWGLFQILGEVAVQRGVFTGRMVNFTDIGANVRAACLLAKNVVNSGGTPDDIIRYFGADPERVYSLMQESRGSVDLLLQITPAIVEEKEEVEQT